MIGLVTKGIYFVFYIQCGKLLLFVGKNSINQPIKFLLFGCRQNRDTQFDKIGFLPYFGVSAKVSCDFAQ